MAIITEMAGAPLHGIYSITEMAGAPLHGIYNRDGRGSIAWTSCRGRGSIAWISCQQDKLAA